MARLSMLFIFAMAILIQETQSKDHPRDYLRIDCGASTISKTLQGTWELDGEFIKTGRNNHVSTANTRTPEEISTLRSFPKGQNNCYKLVLYTPYKYLIRAGFYYGNYDGLSKPPSFSLTINGQYWTTITATNSSTDDEVQYVEVVYPTKESRLELCLVRLGDDVPFISSIEALNLILSSDSYELMNNDSFLNLHSRIAFGRVGDLREAGEYNRIWKLMKMPDYQNVSSLSRFRDYPDVIWANAITPKNTSNSNTTISISIPMPLSPPSPFYFGFYITDPNWSPVLGHIRKIKIYIDGRDMGITEASPNYTDTVVSFYPVTVQGPTANVTLVQSEGSTFPPIINGMEVFSSIEVPTNGGQSIHPISALVCFLLFFTSLAF